MGKGHELQRLSVCLCSRKKVQIILLGVEDHTGDGDVLTDTQGKTDKQGGEGHTQGVHTHRDETHI